MIYYTSRLCKSKGGFCYIEEAAFKDENDLLNKLKKSAGYYPCGSSVYFITVPDQFSPDFRCKAGNTDPAAQ